MRALWITTVVALVLMLARTLLPSGLIIPAIVLTLTVFTVLHGTRRYGLRGVLIYYALALLISNAYENLSILTGFPFGHYHYTDELGPKLFLVPLMIGPAYAATGYLAWTVGTVLVGDVRRGSGWAVTVGTPAIASFAMVAWDLSMDATAATVERQWVWENGGGFFGVPLVNYLGWSLATYTFFQLFALYLRRRGQQADSGQPRAYYLQAVLLYLAFAWQYLHRHLTGDTGTVTDPLGHTWRIADIHETAALTTIYGMVFIAILALITLAQRTPSPAPTQQPHELVRTDRPA